MSRTLAAAVYAALYSQETAEVFAELITINHVDLDAPLYFHSGQPEANLVSRGNTFKPFTFSIPVPAQEEGILPRVDLIMSKVDDETHQLLIQMVEYINTPIEFVYEVVLLSDPDTVVFGPWVFESREVKYNRVQMRATLQFEPIGDLPWPQGRITPGDFPAAFNAVTN